MWVPKYKDGKQTRARTDVVYSIDLVHGLDVYRVQLPGAAARDGGDGHAAPVSGGVVPLGVAGGAIAMAAAIGRLRRRQG